jgi:hypothetical protein
MRYRAQKNDGTFEDGIEGAFDLDKNAAVKFSGDPGVVLGLMLAGGAVTLDALPASPVPEPQTWAMMLAGGLLISTALARRRQTG